MSAPIEADSRSEDLTATMQPRVDSDRPGDPVSGVWAVVPVKGFGAAKERLAGALSGEERGFLAEAMLKDVLSALFATTELAGVLVVTSDDAAARLARQFGAEVLKEPNDSSTNAAVALGLRMLTAEGRRGAVVVPGDIPLTTANDLRDALARARTCPVVLAPAARDGGTNLLLMQPPDLLEPRFGPDSFEKHLAGARSIGIEACILRLDRIALDIDVPDDLATLISRDSGTLTHAFLRQTTIAAETCDGDNRRSLSAPPHEQAPR